MKIIERYPFYLRMFHGEGAWALSRVVTFPASLLYGLLANRRGRGVGKRAGRGSLPAGGAVREGPAVISIGNIEAGGGGKTPCTIAIAEAVSKAGGVPAVVTRAYGSRAEKLGNPLVVGTTTAVHSNKDPFGRRDDAGLKESGQAAEGDLAEALGDEVMLYIERGIPVVIDRDRKRGISTAAEAFSATHVLLDDGFQQRSVRKDLDILLLDWSRPFGNGMLLPAGTLRESPRGASRADAVIFTRCMESLVPAEAARQVEGKKVLFSKEVSECLIDRKGGRVELEAAEGRKAVIFSGIARPRAFENSVKQLGADVTVSYRFPDHHAYTPADIRAITEGGSPGAIYITTEKDSNKAFPLFPSGCELFYLRIRLAIEGIEDLLAGC